MQRALTPHGEKQAARMAAWLDARLPDSVDILCSPALRCGQTVRPLSRKHHADARLAPQATASGILEAAQWPHAKRTVLIVGHQPVLGEVAARLLGAKEGLSIRKGAALWFRARDEGAILLAAMSPDLA